jgi:phosphoribosylanthranilate isomerase
MGIFVKICGLARASDVDAVAALAPDAVGFVFWPESRRAVLPADVAAWTRDFPSDILKVGVFVDASRDEVSRARDDAALDIVQLHGEEDAEFCRSIPSPCWKAVHLDRIGAQRAAAYPVDALLIDSYSPLLPGGTGKTVDWNAAGKFIAGCDTPVLLSGGLHPGNVAEAVDRTRPWGVDVSSGLESRPGEKDISKVKDFIRQCRT